MNLCFCLLKAVAVDGLYSVANAVAEVHLNVNLSWE